MPNPPKTWFLVADSAHAVVYERTGVNGEFLKRENFENPEALLKDRELGEDRPGRVDSPGQTRRNTYQPANLPSDVVADDFARKLTERLEKAAYGKEFENLVLVAERSFLGRLRNFLGTHSKRLLKDEMGKDLHWLSEPELVERLKEMTALR